MPLYDVDVSAAEAVYGITLTEQERKILTAPERTLDPRERQAGYILAMALTGMQCPACLALTCRRAAATDGLPVGGHTPDEAYECPRCGTRLVYHLALIGGEQFFTINPAEALPPKEQS